MLFEELPAQAAECAARRAAYLQDIDTLIADGELNIASKHMLRAQQVRI